MENRCQRCDRVLSDPNAVFGWRCAEILGVSGELSKMGADIFRKFVDGVMKAQRLFGNSNFEFTDDCISPAYLKTFSERIIETGLKIKKVEDVAADRRIHLSNFGKTNRNTEFKNYAAILRERLKAGK